MGMNLEYVPVPIPAPSPQRPRLHRRILGGIARRILDTYRYDTQLWRTALTGPWVICFLAFTAAVLGIPTGLGTAADIMLATTAATLVLGFAGNILAALLALTGLRIPRLYTGSLLSALGAVLLIFYYADLELEAAAAIAVTATLLGGLGGLALGFLRSRRFTIGLVLAALVLASPLALSVGSKDDKVSGMTASAGSPAPILAENPGVPGNYTFHSFTYASGQDLHRTEYGNGTELITSSVDASDYIKSWPRLRTLFWGFDYSALPVNARVWMPDGDGLYPLVLMVHGNHMMEDYSEGGYAYLGEQLASRGFIAVSLDENFLNYSAWSGIPDNDFKVRTWMILKHLQQIGDFTEQPGNPFYQKVDYSRTALLGHSRGGQAVAMAADAGRWFKNDPVYAATGKFHIASVIALAPTDKTIDDEQASLVDVNYLTLQGARDGDVHDFYGDRQYIRSSFTGAASSFKSSLYIADANHSQFNTSWGLYDQSLPAGLLLDRTEIMDGEAQRQIAKVYVTAFLETTLYGEEVYQNLFRDYRSGLQWLPDTAYYSRFQSGDYIPLATFDEDRIKGTAAGGTAEAVGLAWSEETAMDRESKSKATYGLLLEHKEKGREAAFYRLKLKDSIVARLADTEAAGLTFSMANRNADIVKTKGKEEPAISPTVEVELTDGNGTAARLPLNEFMDILPLPQTRFTILPWLEERMSDGKYGDLSEAVFQTYELPFERFLEKEPRLEPDKLSTITFYLQGEGDRIMLDDIGFYHKGNGMEGSKQTAIIQ
ncbi:alpha/beta hydrolase family protein [Paenibacillus sp. sgz5001063]|uniref:alpha/beta hydrolase family protein n=1 Tax=Paenibacillus sp. sgz5001063 TaxID=3242474 RepID=UPI0036D334DE